MLFLIIAGSISNKHGSQMGQPTMRCGILLIAFIILIWP
ncbi:Transposase for insertion sequence element D [Bacillus cereus Rock4-18]|nr:Transposase for insertion sequence element D [Bacillus cereus Rock4-18]